MKKIVYVDMDNVLTDWDSGLAKVGEDIRQKYKKHPDEIPGIFALMDPMPGAIEAMHLLQEKFDMYILSTAPWYNPSAWGDKKIWVGRFFDDIFHKRLIITHHKELMRGDFLIDDRERNGASDFEGEWIQFGSDRFPNWNAISNYLLSKEE